MSRPTREKIASEIIKRYFENDEVSEISDRTKRRIMRWLTDKENGKLKDAIVREIYDNIDDQSHRPSDMKIRQLMSQIFAEGEEYSGNHQSRSTFFKSPLQKVAAVVLPLIMIAGGYIYMNQDRVPIMEAQWEINDGITKDVVLADSSHIWINAGSNLKVRQSKSERTAELSGESYFSVAKDAKRPFIVKAGDLKVSVLGTEFNVEAYPESENTIVTLMQGSINLETSAGQRWTLSPNQQLIYNKITGVGVIMYLESTKAENQSAWIDGRKILEMKTLTEIFREIEHRFDLQIEIDPTLNLPQMRYTIQFQADDTPDRVLQALVVLTDMFEYKIVNNTVKITEPSTK